MRITVLGTGAMACAIGGRLAVEAGENLTLVGTWVEGLHALRERGISLEGMGDESLKVPVGVAALEDPIPPADLVIVLVKAHQTARVAHHLPRLLAPRGLVLTLQNGLGNVEQLGPNALLGVTSMGATLLGPGRVRVVSEGLTQIAGPAWLADLFRFGGLPAEAVPPEKATSLLWGKLAINCGINALTALLHVPNGGLLNRPDATLLMDRAAVECAMVAWAQAIELPYADPVQKVRQVAQATAPNRSSMLQDVNRGVHTEVDFINGAVVREGKRLGIPTTVNEVLWRLVRALVKEPQVGLFPEELLLNRNKLKA